MSPALRLGHAAKSDDINFVESISSKLDLVLRDLALGGFLPRGGPHTEPTHEMSRYDDMQSDLAGRCGAAIVPQRRLPLSAASWRATTLRRPLRDSVAPARHCRAREACVA